MVTAGFTSAYLGMLIPFYYFPEYGMTYGMSSAMGNYLLATLNAGSFFGRIISRFLADKIGGFVSLPGLFKWFGLSINTTTRFNMTVTTSFPSSIVLLTLLSAKNEASIVAFSAIYGLFPGGLISLQAAKVAWLTVNMNTYGTMIGLQMAVNPIG